MPAEQGGATERNAAGFGASLADLRRARGVSQREAAAAAGITPEHLCRIERDRRPPPRRSAVIRLLAALGLPPTGPAAAGLLAAAGYAADPPVDPRVGRAAEALLRGARTGDAPPTVVWSAGGPSLEDIPSVVRGADGVAGAAVALLKEARCVPAGDAIVQTFGPGVEGRFGTRSVRPVWYDGLRDVLARGWRFRRLWPLSDDGTWAAPAIAELAALLARHGRYEPFVASAADLSAWSPRDLLVVPGVGAVVGLRGDGSAVGGALVVREPSAVAALTAHADALLRGAEPLVSTYLVGAAGAAGNGDRVRFTEALAAAYEGPGESGMVKDGPPLRAAPSDAWWAAYARANGGDDYRARLHACRVRVRRAIASQLRTHRYREACTMRGLRRFVERGDVAGDDYLLGGLPPLSREERAEALLALLRQLHRFPNYELALLDDAHEDLARAVWLTKGTEFFSLEVAGRDANGRCGDVMIAVSAAPLVAGFRDAFDQAWQALPPRLRDRAATAAWLERQLDALR